VREADGDPQLVVGLVVEDRALPLPEGRRAAAQVDDDVPDAAAGAADELALARIGLEVHPAHGAAARARVVVLREGLRDAVIGPPIGAPGLHEEAPLVAEHARREQRQAVDPGLEPLHRAGD
jgi:hypothetical protein